MILTITDAKGGTGKTTTAVALAAELAALRDLDTQASATLAPGLEPAAEPWAAEMRRLQERLPARWVTPTLSNAGPAELLPEIVVRFVAPDGTVRRERRICNELPPHGLPATPA